MTIKRTDARFRVREDIFDSITPNCVVQEDIRAPAGEWKPAAWLPIEWTQTNRDAGTDAFVCSKGKVVAMDAEGRIVPAGLRVKWMASGCAAAVAITYTSTDYDYGVIDITTGETYATDGTTTYTGQVLANALVERGLVSEFNLNAAGAATPIVGDTDTAICLGLFISYPIGIASDNIYVWSGQPQDGDQVFTNYSKQHLVQFLTELQMVVPHRVHASTTQVFDAATLDGAGSTVITPGQFILAGEYWDATNLHELNRYASQVDTTDNIVALGIGSTYCREIAKNTSRTPFTCEHTGVLVRERSSIATVTQEGDWYLDADVGVLFLHSDTWDTLVALGAHNVTLTYHYYGTSSYTAANRYPHLDGQCRPGDFVSYDEHSNFVAVTPSAFELHGGSHQADVPTATTVGRVLRVIEEPRGYLDKVKTAWNLTGMSAASQMPGTATSGYSDAITLSVEEVADQLVVINVRI